MKIINPKLAYGWRGKVLSEALITATQFIENLYGKKFPFDVIKIKLSEGCNHSSYYNHSKKIRLRIGKDNLIYLYERKSLGTYKTAVPCLDYKIIWTSSLIHELTHFIQYYEGRRTGEVETTRNELLYLESTYLKSVLQWKKEVNKKTTNKKRK
jgi:hypothetical protein